MRPGWVLQAVRDPDEIWVHPDRRRKVTYVRGFEDGFGGVTRVVVIAVQDMPSGLRVCTAFEVWPHADWAKIGIVRKWSRARDP